MAEKGAYGVHHADVRNVLELAGAGLELLTENIVNESLRNAVGPDEGSGVSETLAGYVQRTVGTASEMAAIDQLIDAGRIEGGAEVLRQRRDSCSGSLLEDPNCFEVFVVGIVFHLSSDGRNQGPV